MTRPTPVSPTTATDLHFRNVPAILRRRRRRNASSKPPPPTLPQKSAPLQQLTDSHATSPGNMLPTVAPSPAQHQSLCTPHTDEDPRQIRNAYSRLRKRFLHQRTKGKYAISKRTSPAHPVRHREKQCTYLANAHAGATSRRAECTCMQREGVRVCAIRQHLQHLVTSSSLVFKYLSRKGGQQ